ncbi:glycerate kinase [Staphylococcus felis]|uniref:glycerate kinase n=1 Tax=Staphylococcus felis TaxID=46127 RepID=UPI000E25F425|nr:glycerate kinase [Staphylococcus felis]REH79620.1 glycerate kinase [Staphylococcus felis]REI32520.1 glycerate kinase [Staphylococcus felis]
MKVLVAMDEFNGIISSYDANRYVEEAIASEIERADIVQVPLFNGRHELLNSIFLWKSGTQYHITAHDAEMNEVEVTYGQTDDGMTIIEAGQFLKGQRFRPNHTSYGLGEVICHALDKKTEHIVISLGAIDTSDGGVGMLQALGCRFYDDEGRLLDMKKGATQIKYIRKMDTNDIHEGLKKCQIQLVSDFNSKLYGKKSEIMQTYQFIDISRDTAVEIDNLLWYLAELFKSQLQLALGPIERGGAGGGIASAMHALFGAEILSSHELVDQITELDGLVKEADLVIFGEGVNEKEQIIETSSLKIAELCQKHHKVAVAICGTSAKFNQYETLGVTGMFNTFIEMPQTYTDFKMGIQLRSYARQAVKLLQAQLPA